MHAPLPTGSVTPTDFGSLLALLTGFGVDFVLVGPVAARGRGANIALGDVDASAVDITPCPDPTNLIALTRALARAGNPRLRVNQPGPSQPLTIDAKLFEYVPVLPLSTDVADLTVIQHPVGGPFDYDTLRRESGRVEIDGVAVLAPTVETLLEGPAGGWLQPNPLVVAELRRLQRSAKLQVVAEAEAARQTIADPDRELGRVLQTVLDTMGHAMSVRELLFAVGDGRPVTYKQVKAVAEHLTAHGQLLREKAGQAHRYRLDIDVDSRTAHEVAALLMASSNPDIVTTRALALLRQTTN